MKIFIVKMPQIHFVSYFKEDNYSCLIFRSLNWQPVNFGKQCVNVEGVYIEE